jgi:arylsulfatase A-like enzyme
MCAAAAIMVAAVADGIVVWLRTFGLLEQNHLLFPLSLVSVGLGVVICANGAGRRTLHRLHSAARILAVAGAVSVLSLPFSGWRTATSPAANVPTSATSALKPNVLLITIDTLSAEHMSLYGAKRRTTPNLDEFAEHATVFDRAYANGNFTTPGIASILTATRPWTHRAFQLEGWPSRDARSKSLPSLLRDSGYQTGFVSTSPWAGAARNGFRSYFDFAAPDAVTNLTACRDALSAMLPYDCVANQLSPFVFGWKVLEKLYEATFDRPPNWQFDPRMAIKPALGWLASADKHTPIFLWVHLLPPHSPYAAPEPWLGMFDSSSAARSFADSDSKSVYLFATVSDERAHVLAARYDESISYVDHFVGDLLEQSLRLLGDKTVVIVTADHGESFTHGYGMHTGPGLYESIIHVPLIIKVPHQMHGARTAVIAEQVDIAPTVAEIVRAAPFSTWEGRSLLEFAGSPQEQPPPSPRAAFAMNFEENSKYSALTTGSVAVVEGNWKFVEYLGRLHYPMMPPLLDALYDLSRDPGEQTNEASRHTDEVVHLRGLIDSQLAAHGAALQ